MARPRRSGVDYFPFDVDFFSDARKIKPLRSRYGADGVILYLYLLCEIYRDKGYYFECDEDTDYLLAAELGLNIDRVREIKTFLLERSLFDSGLFESANVLSSKGVQRRYQLAVKGRAVKNPVAVQAKLWLLDEEETEAFIEVRRENTISENYGDNSRKNSDSSGIYTTKQSKANKSKVNESKAEQSKETAPGEPGFACCAAHDEFERIKRLTPQEAERITALVSQYGEECVIAAIRDALRKGGRSLAYVERILTDAGSAARSAGLQSWYDSGRHQPSYDCGEVEALMYDEWFAGELGG